MRTNQLVYIIDLRGEMSLFDSNRLKEVVMKMIEKKVERLIINVKDVKTIDSSGIGALIFISSTFKKMNLELAIANVHGAVSTVLEKTKLSGYFPLYEKIGDAISALSH
ncbi:MAG: STAS domain-containing protein [Treponema sp.]|nr:STAS domain-containing protein [Treponema sp.]